MRKTFITMVAAGLPLIALVSQPATASSSTLAQQESRDTGSKLNNHLPTAQATEAAAENPGRLGKTANAIAAAKLLRSLSAKR